METRRDFVRFISHETRTSLNSVKMGLVLLKKSVYAGDRNEMLTTLSEVEDACTASIETLNDFLSYEKLNCGLLTLEKSLVNAWEFFSDTMKPFILQVQLINRTLSLCSSVGLHEYFSC